MAILPEISGPDDVKRLDAKQLDELAAELRQTIIDTVSRQGGHLASNLGDVELTIALHRAFNSRRISWFSTSVIRFTRISCSPADRSNSKPCAPITA